MIFRHNKFVPVRNSAGFSMIDVLVAIIVLATALLALASLQGALTRNAADSRARSQVAAFSEGLIDQARAVSYDCLGSAAPSCTTATTSGTVTITPSNTGTQAQKNAYSAQLAAGVSNLSAKETVTTYYGGATGAFTTTAPTKIDSTTPQYKKLDVTTTWTDASGTARTLAVNTVVSPVTIANDSTLVTKVLYSPTSTAQTPIVRELNPAGPGVIPIAVGGGSDTAATNPKPEILGKQNNLLVGTSFNVLTYQAPVNNEVVVQQRIENRVIRCSCKYGAGISSTSNVFAQPFRPTYWDGTKYVVPAATTAKTSTTGVDSAATQDSFCDSCCRDRTDTSADTIKFDSFTSDYSHYRYDSTDTLVKVPSSDVTDPYINACRMIRVDGQFRVATDMRNYFFGLLATKDQSTATLAATSPIPDDTYVTKYQGFVTDYLTQSITGLAAGTGPLATSTAATMYGSSTYNLDNPTNIGITYIASIPDLRYLHARGLYVDHLEPKALTAINNAIANCVSPSTTADCVLPLLPFTTINETELANWTVTPVVTGDPPNVNNDIQVSDALLIGGNASAPLRGIVNPLASSTNNDVAYAVATIGLSNSGVTGEDIIDAAVDVDDKATLTDSQKFTVTAPLTVISDKFTTGFTGISQLSGVSNISLDPSVSWSGTASQLGTASSGSCPGTLTKSGTTYTPSYLCTASTTNTPPVALSLTVQKYNQTANGGTESAGGCGTVTTATQCFNYAVNAANITVNGTVVTGATATLLGGTTDGGLLEGAVITMPKPPGVGTITTSPYDIISIPFTLTATTIATGSCTTKNPFKYTNGTCAN